MLKTGFFAHMVRQRKDLYTLLCLWIGICTSLHLISKRHTTLLWKCDKFCVVLYPPPPSPPRPLLTWDLCSERGENRPRSRSGGMAKWVQKLFFFSSLLLSVFLLPRSITNPSYWLRWFKGLISAEAGILICMSGSLIRSVRGRTVDTQYSTVWHCTVHPWIMIPRLVFSCYGWHYFIMQMSADWWLKVD